jgi:uncharacterized protein YjbI with pentapeptide repeats
LAWEARIRIKLFGAFALLGLLSASTANAQVDEHVKKVNKGKDCVDCILSWSDFSNKDLSGVNLSESVFFSTDMIGANLSNANLKEADLQSTDLTGANLSNANLRQTDLTWTDFTGADLTGADLRFSVGENTIFTGAIFCRTIMDDESINNSGC